VTRPAKILIDSLELHGFHGWHKHEGEFGQHFMVDLDMLVDIAEAERTDQLAAALDYGAVIAATRRLFGERRHRLLEAVAMAVARGLLREFPRVEEITIRVKKLAPPVPDRLAFAGVQVTVGREEIGG
jgi:dihydroneopterin aldolase